jgi:hypothetical protein
VTAEQLASDDFRATAVAAGVAALDPSLREFGWGVSIDVQAGWRFRREYLVHWPHGDGAVSTRCNSRKAEVGGE